MIGAHIVPGDLAVVDKARKARSGDIVLAYVNGEFTIKRYELKKDSAYLVAENPAYLPIRVVDADPNYGIERTLKVVLDLITVKFLSSYATKPIYVFGGAGFLSIFLSMLAGSWAVYLKLIGYADFIQTPLPLLTVTLFMVGVQLIMMGLLAEVIMRTYHESQDKATYTVRNTLNLEG